MAVLMWPLSDGEGHSFPQVPGAVGFKYVMPTMSQTFEPDVGPIIVRRIAAGGAKTIQATWELTLAQARRLEKFWMNPPAGTPPGCAGGSVPFNLPHPFDESRVVEVVMPTPPEIEGVSSNLFIAKTTMVTTVEFSL